MSGYPIPPYGDDAAKEWTPPVVRFSGDEGRDRAMSPSLNAPHSYSEALLACLMSARDGMTHPTGVNQPFGPDASAVQQEWLEQAYREVQGWIEARINRERAHPASGPRVEQS